MALSKRESKKGKVCKDIKMILWLILQRHYIDVVVNAKLSKGISECQDLDH